MECEGLAMVYVLQNSRHYLLGRHFKMHTDHFALKYLVNKLAMGQKIYRWLLLLQEYDFEVIMKPGRLNVGLDHLSQIETGEEPNNLEEGFPDAPHFVVCIADNILQILSTFLLRGWHQKGIQVNKRRS